MSELIWISDWQIQCCGSEFAIGDRVMWPVLARTSVSGGSSPMLGDEVGAAITGVYERHDDDVPEMSGVVRRIRTLSLVPATDPAAPETAVLEDVTAIEKWYGTDFDPKVLRFRGWLADLEVST